MNFFFGVSFLNFVYSCKKKEVKQKKQFVFNETLSIQSVRLLDERDRFLSIFQHSSQNLSIVGATS